MKRGKIKEYDPNRGCGVVVENDTGEQLVVYANYIILKEGEALKAGQNVEFETENNRSRDRVINLKILLA